MEPSIIYLESSGIDGGVGEGIEQAEAASSQASPIRISVEYQHEETPIRNISRRRHSAAR